MTGVAAPDRYCAPQGRRWRDRAAARSPASPAGTRVHAVDCRQDSFRAASRSVTGPFRLLWSRLRVRLRPRRRERSVGRRLGSRKRREPCSSRALSTVVRSLFSSAASRSSCRWRPACRPKQRRLAPEVGRHRPLEPQQDRLDGEIELVVAGQRDHGGVEGTVGVVLGQVVTVGVGAAHVVQMPAHRVQPLRCRRRNQRERALGGVPFEQGPQSEELIDVARLTVRSPACRGGAGARRVPGWPASARPHAAGPD